MRLVPRAGHGQMRNRMSTEQLPSPQNAQKQLRPLASKLESAAGKPDPALQKQVEQIANSNGFSKLDEFDDVAANISFCSAGLILRGVHGTSGPDVPIETPRGFARNGRRWGKTMRRKLERSPGARDTPMLPSAGSSRRLRRSAPAWVWPQDHYRRRTGSSTAKRPPRIRSIRSANFCELSVEGR